MSLAASLPSDSSYRGQITVLRRTFHRCTVASVPIDHLTLDEATSHIIEVLRLRLSEKPLLIMGPNAQLVTLATRNERFAAALKAADLNIADGISVVLASRLLGGPIRTRVTGGDLMENLCKSAAGHHLRIFFLGGLPGSAELAADRLQQRYPGLIVVDTYCPPVGFEHSPAENLHVRQRITAAAPDLLFVALGAPKQEVWMHENCPTLPIGAALSVGAAFDTQAGLRKRAPQWTHRFGIEWLYRLSHEPRRLWRRYLIGNAHFLYLILREYLAEHSSTDFDQPSQKDVAESHPFAQNPEINPQVRLTLQEEYPCQASNI